MKPIFSNGTNVFKSEADSPKFKCVNFVNQSTSCVDNIKTLSWKNENRRNDGHSHVSFDSQKHDMCDEYVGLNLKYNGFLGLKTEGHIKVSKSKFVESGYSSEHDLPKQTNNDFHSN